ncbi:hypothetical protein CI610_00490 [invertebrate metagenome]|uniref:Uncharacterized protein n=1 Tax=invertebrate metagenome TaxID=1711999 RepID=A0A2H9TB98_9ZZZZ
MRYSFFAAAALSAALSGSAYADVIQDIRTKGAHAVIQEALQQGASLEAVMANLVSELQDSPQMLSQIIAKAVQAFPQQAAQIVSVAITMAPMQSAAITQSAMTQVSNNPAAQAAIRQASMQAIQALAQQGDPSQRTEVEAENQELPGAQPLAPPPPPPTAQPAPRDKPTGISPN